VKHLLLVLLLHSPTRDFVSATMQTFSMIVIVSALQRTRSGVKYLLLLLLQSPTRDFISGAM